MFVEVEPLNREYVFAEYDETKKEITLILDNKYISVSSIESTVYNDFPNNDAFIVNGTRDSKNVKGYLIKYDLLKAPEIDQLEKLNIKDKFGNYR